MHSFFKNDFSQRMAINDHAIANINDVISRISLLFRVMIRTGGYSFLSCFINLFFLEYLNFQNENGEKNFYQIVKTQQGSMTDTILLMITLCLIASSLLLAISDENSETLEIEENKNNEFESFNKNYRI